MSGDEQILRTLLDIRDGLQARVKTLEEAINKVYPNIAGRVIQLGEAGEFEAQKEWNQIACILHDALEATS